MTDAKQRAAIPECRRRRKESPISNFRMNQRRPTDNLDQRLLTSSPTKSLELTLELTSLALRLSQEVMFGYRDSQEYVLNPTFSRFPYAAPAQRRIKNIPRHHVALFESDAIGFALGFNLG